MSNLTLPAVIGAAVLAADAVWLGSDGLVFATRELVDLVDWLAFWR
jgi:hypothetical protein